MKPLLPSFKNNLHSNTPLYNTLYIKHVNLQYLKCFLFLFNVRHHQLVIYVQSLKMVNFFVLQNHIFQYTNPLPFETEPFSIHAIPLLREQPDSYLYYIRYETYDVTLSQPQFQVIFNPVEGVITGIHYRRI